MWQHLLVLLLFVSSSTCNQPPRITDDLSGTRISESAAINTRIGQMRAVDPEGVGINYALTSENFRIDRRSGEVFLIQKLDYEAATSVTAVLRVNSFDDDVQITTSTTTFRVLDANDIAPVFTQEAFSGAVDEGSPNGTVAVASIVVTDRDITGPGLRVECDRPNVPAQFAGVCDIFEVQVTERIQVERWGGRIVLRGEVSFSEKIVWQVPLKAFDGVFTTRASAEIRLNDIQNQPPIFTSAANQVVIELLPGAVITEVLAVDQDSFNSRLVVYSLVENPGNLFMIETMNITNRGEISNVRTLDRDRDPALADGFVTVVVMAREVINATAGIYGNDSLTTATASIIVTVTGINDNAPTFSRSGPIRLNLTEDAPNGSPVPGLSLTVSDADQGVDASFQLSLVPLNPPTPGVFEVHPTRGRELANVGIRVKDSSMLDYDGAVKNYALFLVATETESTGVRLSSSVIVAISLVDVNDLRPVFNQDSYSFSVSETAGAGTLVGSGISATDGDTGLFGTAGIRYSLVGNGAEKFAIADPTRPQVSVASCSGSPGVGPSCLDRETQASYSLFLVATDNLGTGNSNSTALIIAVTDENDNTPTFTAASGFYEFFINEGQTSGSPVFQVTAADLDSSSNGNNRVQYSLLGENSTAYSGLWQVLTGGVITATRPVDFEAIPGHTGRYEFFVQAQDSSPPFRSSVARVVINVNDMNDNAPAFRLSSPVELTILEGAAPSRFLIDLIATDNDLPTTSNGRISYSIESGSQERFTIDLNNGSLYTTATATFQFELQSLYSLTVVAQDGGRPQLQASMRVNVRVIDINNKIPYFTQSPKRVQVLENAAVNSFVTQMAAIDQDASADLHYTVMSVAYRRPDGTQPPNNVTFFNVDSSTANVTVAQTLNRDVVSEATLVIHVVDRNATTTQTATASLIIVVLDVNDQGPSFASPWTLASPFYNASMDEEEPIGSFVMVLTATDVDGPISEYRVVSDPLNAFSISSSGAVTLRGRLDYEAHRNATFAVVAVDSGSPALSATTTVSLSINNVNDVTPAFSLNQYSFSLIESNGTAARENQFLGVINATDADFGDFGRLTFSIVSTDFFLVTSETGAEVYANGTSIFDREARGQVVVQLRVADSPSDPSVRRFTSVPLYVSFTDINDNAPRFVVTDYYVTVGSNSPNGSVLLTISATDPDLNSTLRYSLTASASAALFAVDAVSGAVTTAASLSASSGTLTVGGVVSDGLFTASCTIHITVLESSRAPPSWLFPGVNASLQLLEEQYRGLIVARLQASQDNSSTSGVTRLTYGIIHEGEFVQETPLFRVNPVTGVLTANAIFDREVTSRHLLNLAVRDQRTPPLEARRLIAVDVIDVDDNAPRFSLSSYTFSIAENMPANTSIGQVTATDADSGENAVVSYEIVSGNIGNAFRIDSSSGRLFAASVLDRESVESYSLKVAAASGSRAASAVGASVVSVNITIADINDNAPVFSASNYYGSVAYDSSFGQLLTTAAATDRDYAENAQIAYRLDDTRSLMQVDSTGRVTLVNLVPEANTAAHTGVLFAWNPNRLAVSSTATVSVWFSDASSVAKLVTGRSPDWVVQHLDQLLQQVQQATNATKVFANRVRYHLDRGGASDLTKTDVLVSAVGADMRLMTGSAVASRVRARAANTQTSANLQFLQLQSAVTYDEEADKLDVSLPIVLSISALAAVLVGTAAYAIALYCMQQKLAASCKQQAAMNQLQFLQIEGVK